MSFFFDSFDNHQKIHLADTFTSVTNTTQATDITHNLGYFPNIRLFYEPISGDVWPATTNSTWSAIDKYCTAAQYTDKITITTSAGAGTHNIPVHYRIYQDGSTLSQLRYDSTKRIERILGTFTGSFTAASGIEYEPVITTHTIPHGLGEKCLPVLEWSQDGTTWIDQDMQQTDVSDWGRWVNAIAHCDATNVKIEAQNTYASSKTIHYRVILLKINSGGLTFDSTKKTLLNFESGTASFTASGSVGSNSTATFSTSVPMSAEGFGQIYYKTSTLTTEEKLSPPVRLDSVGSTGGNLQIRFSYEYAPSALTIRGIVFNPGVSSATLTSKTFNFRYVLFRRS